MNPIPSRLVKKNLTKRNILISRIQVEIFHDRRSKLTSQIPCNYSETTEQTSRVRWILERWRNLHTSQLEKHLKTINERTSQTKQDKNSMSNIVFFFPRNWQNIDPHSHSTATLEYQGLSRLLGCDPSTCLLKTFEKKNFRNNNMVDFIRMSWDSTLRIEKSRLCFLNTI